jgi:HlyD family secretion protein
MFRFRMANLVVTAAFVACGSACDTAGPPVAVGTLERDRIELRAEQREPILEILVTEGDDVVRGDVLARLDSRRTRARLEASRAARDAAEARFREVVRGARSEEIDEARALLEEARADLVRRQPDLERARSLVAQGVESQSMLDSAQASFSAAEARRDAARATLERLLNGATVEELDQARAELALREAESAEIAIQLDRLTILAPRAGRIDALPFEVGDEPPAGSTVAVMLAEGAPYARVYIPMELRPSLSAGDAVTVAVEGIARPFEGRIRTVSSEAAFTPYFALTERDRGRLAYLAEIDLQEDEAADLPTGLPVEVDF